ncbi:hypothetical protein ACFB49_32710 [Sphingomonas sp. DBB INV C78]|uniref:nuclear transport factor 2 family protein n=1 Tax=Sphingomonas sp. DBB INV C78 TaxID=3349434 RepID=UPI0036D3CA61
MLRDLFLETYSAIPAHSTRAHIERVVHAYLSSYASDDIAGRVSLFAEDVVVEEPVGAPVIRGRDALVTFWHGSIEAGWQCSNELERLVVNGDEAFLCFRSNLSLRGEGTVSLSVFETLTFNEHGLIRQLRAFNDETCLS